MNRMMVTAALAALALNGGCMTQQSQQYSDSDALSKAKTSPDWKKFWSNEKPTCKPEPTFMPLTPQEYKPATVTMVAAPSVPPPPSQPTSSPSRLLVPPAPAGPSAAPGPSPTAVPVPPIPVSPTVPPAAPSPRSVPSSTPPVPQPPLPPTLPPPTAKVTIANVRGEAVTVFRLQQQKLVFVAQVPAGKAVDQTIQAGTVLVATLASAPHCVHYTVEKTGGVFLIRESEPQPTVATLAPCAPPTAGILR